MSIIEETDEEKRARYAVKIAEYEEKIEVVRTSFDIDEFVASKETVLEVEVPEVSYLLERQKLEVLINEGKYDEFEKALKQLTPRYTTVKYKRLRNSDIIDLNKINNQQERGLQTLFLLMSRADPLVTMKKIRDMDPIETTRITAAITEKTPLFLR
jgi:hypothetical protein